jgi:lysyl-tRNA synthetase class 2
VTGPVAYWRLRAALKEAIRSFFAARGYLELDTPIAVPLPGTEVHLRYFATAWLDHQGVQHPLWLRSSPELHLKQAVARGAPRVFQLAPCFRNGGERADWHHPEFTMLEWYETGIAFEAYIDQTEALLRETLARLQPLVRTTLGREPLALPARVERIPVAEAFLRFAGLELVDLDPDLARRAVAAGVLSVRPDDDFETAYFKVQLDRIEPALAALGAAVLVDYPPSQAALALVRGGVAKRFEFYVNGVELCNGFEELLGRDENEVRIKDNLARRRTLGYEVPSEDPAFYAALDQGLPPCCGNALGFDRWLALVSSEISLDRVIPFRS